MPTQGRDDDVPPARHYADIITVIAHLLRDPAITAISREKQIKKYKRSWKYHLIEKDNPQWLDLYSHILGN